MEPIQQVILCQCCRHFFDTEREFRYHMRNEHRATFPLVRTERCKKIKNTKLWKRLLPFHDKRTVVQEGKFRVKLRHFEIRFKNTQQYVFT